VPVQLASAALLLCSADCMQARYEAGAVAPLTALFFFFVLLAATQDVAVDGWALTLLPHHHVAYASTCQTLGMNIGYFSSFTIFLALSNAEFCDQYIRGSAAGGEAVLQHWRGTCGGSTGVAGVAGSSNCTCLLVQCLPRPTHACVHVPPH
jgi:hypothetical protein